MKKRKTLGLVPRLLLGLAAGLLIALYIIQDSFGTACNVSGDNALAVGIDAVYRKHILGAVEKIPR